MIEATVTVLARSVQAVLDQAPEVVDTDLVDRYFDPEMWDPEDITAMFE
ncbi:MAG: hypothetical protein ACTSUO_08485 [Candidatus Thorarchaeota archaeon]